jgi:hypothetical protein
MSWKTKIRSVFLWLGFGGALLILAGAYAIDRAYGTEVLLVAAHDAATVELNRALYVHGDSVADLYGNPLSDPVRILFAPNHLLIRPEEDESLVLYPVDKQAGENPLQAQTLWFFLRYAVPGLAFVGVLGLFLPRRRFQGPVSGAEHAFQEEGAETGQ